LGSGWVFQHAEYVSFENEKGFMEIRSLYLIIQQRVLRIFHQKIKINQNSREFRDLKTLTLELTAFCLKLQAESQ